MQIHLVDDGLGGTEPRFSCNVNIQSPGEAFNLINELSGVMRCMPIWSAGSISITQDKPVPIQVIYLLYLMLLKRVFHILEAA